MSVVIPSLRAAVAVPGWAKNVLWRNARAVPSLDLRFAENKSLVDAVTGASLITFTRASSGTFVDSAGVLQTAATDEPRFDHSPTTGESLGLLVEEQRTNLAIYSEDPTQWTASACSLGSPTRLNRYGDGNVSSFLADGTASAHRIARAVSGSVTANALYSFSFLVAKSSNSDTRLITARLRTAVGGQAVSINVSDDGAASSYSFRSSVPFGASPPAAITSNEMFVSVASDGWTRITLVTAASNANTTLSQWDISFGPSAAGIELIAGTANTLLFVDQVQIEAGAFPTSYIPTTTAAATRSADVASISGSNFSSWYNQTEGTVFAEMDRNTAISSSSTVVSINDNSSNNRLYNFRQDSASALTVISATGGTLDGALGVTLANTSNRNRVAAAQSLNNLAAAANGGTVLSDTSVAMPTVTQVQIGNVTGTSYFNGTIRRICFWPTRLPANTLQSITQ